MKERTDSLWSWRGVKLVLLAWLAMLGFDFFLHGGLLARLYTTPSPFLLSPMESFRRIPIGYLSFLIAAGFLVWLTSRMGIRGPGEGLKFGAVLGGVMWFSLAIGLYSISTARPLLLAGWAVGQTVEMAYAGAVVGYGAKRASLRKPFVWVLATSFVLVILTIVMQSTGLAPAIVIE